MTRPPLLRAWSADELIVDSFAGGGGASKGIELALGRSPDVAINHDAEAIALHRANHPATEHHTEDVWKVDPVEACRGKPVGLMWLSPDCTHHSKARGGKPRKKKIRGLAWTAVRWASVLGPNRPRVIVLENVEEFQTWGPLLDNGQPDKERAGKTFRAFVAKLRHLGYEVQWRELRACDYGAPTIRKRLFIVARCDGQPIVWPKPSHGKYTTTPWRTAADCIQWEITCPSIFARKKPLAENTLKRIARGLRKFVIESPRPFIVPFYGLKGGETRAHRVDEPLRTLTADPKFSLVAPLIVPTAHQGDARTHSIEDPLRTVTGARRGDHALVAPTLIEIGYGERKGQAPRAPGLDKPLGTLVGSRKHALVSAFLAKHFSEHGEQVQGASLFAPTPTVTAVDHNALVAASLVNLRGTDDSQLAGRSVEEPMPTISGGGIHAAEVRAFLVAYFGNEKDGGDLFNPMRTVTSKDRFGLVTVEGVEYQIADIGMRMLEPRELYRVQGFPDSYLIDIPFTNPTTGVTKPMTKTAKVRMVGNSVCPPLAAAIVSANCPELAAQERAA
jgi:DNA (cytosine-5)-methyltransferase 1